MPLTTPKIASKTAPGAALAAAFAASPVLLLVLAAYVAAAVPPPDDTVTYSRRVWRSIDGLPEDFPQSVAQTKDGYVWIGTSAGLVRFDGARFVVFSRENVPAFRDDSIYCLLVSRDGTLWAGTEGGGLVRYKNSLFRCFGAAEGLTNSFVRVIFEDKAGTIWVGTDAGLFQLREETLIRIDGSGTTPQMNVHSICEDRNGRLLVGGWGLLIITGQKSTYYSSTESLADNSIRTLCQTADGTIWVGTVSGLRKIESGVTGDPFAVRKTISGVNISVLLESRRGQLWIATYGQGLLRYQKGRIVSFSAPSSLPNNNLLALFEDQEEDLWVGTQGGLLRLNPSAAETITTTDGAPQSINTIYQDPRGDLLVTALNGKLFRLSSVSHQALVPMQVPGAESLPVRNAFRDSTGALWLGTDGQGVARIGDGRVARYTMREGLTNDFIRAFCEDRDGGIWIGTDGGLSRWHSGTFKNFDITDGLVYRSIRALLLDRQGRLWIATDGGLSRFQNEGFAVDPTLDRLRGRKIWALYEDANGSMWIGTRGSGLFLLNGDELRQFTTAEGLPSNKIHFITGDAQGNLWMSGPSGIVSVAKRDLESLSNSSGGPLAMRVYTTAEGLSTNQMTGGVQPAGALTSSGELWFPSTRGAVRVEPLVPDRTSTLPVLIEQLLADNQDIPFSGGVRLSPGEGKLEIHYTAIRLRSPERARFKYLMEGFDRDWTDAGQRRIAYYTNLPPGHYRFRVIAYEVNDPGNAAEHVLNIELQPHFYQTGWFLALCVLAATTAAWGLYWLHVRNLRKRFVAVLDERNRLAREMHDTLIQGCIGVSALLEAASRAQDVSPHISSELLDRARDEVRLAVDDARRAVWDLRQGSGDGEQLVAAISQLAQRTGLESGIAVHFESSGPPLALGADGGRNLLLIIREALQNAVRHAAPKNVRVVLSFEGRLLRLKIIDDGCGFDSSIDCRADGRHYGLVGMRERVEKLGGVFDLTSAPGKGTQIHLRIPLRKVWLFASSQSFRRILPRFGLRNLPR